MQGLALQKTKRLEQIAADEAELAKLNDQIKNHVQANIVGGGEAWVLGCGVPVALGQGSAWLSWSGAERRSCGCGQAHAGFANAPAAQCWGAMVASAWGMVAAGLAVNRESGRVDLGGV